MYRDQREWRREPSGRRHDSRARRGSPRDNNNRSGRYRRNHKRSPERRQRSYEELSPERDIQLPKRRKRNKPSGWDQLPTPGELSGGVVIGDASFTVIPRERVASTGVGPAVIGKLGKQARRVYAGNLPETNEHELMRFFNQAMKKCLIDDPDANEPSILSVYLKMDKRFGFVEFRSPEEATAALQLDGIEFKGYYLKLRRPSDYNAAMFPNSMRIPRIDPTRVGLAPSAVSLASPDKIFVGGFPSAVREEQIKEILECFGKLRIFHLVRDKDTEESRGYCFVEYDNPLITDEACAGLSGIPVGDSMISARRAVPIIKAQGPIRPIVAPAPAPSQQMLPRVMPSQPEAPSTVICLLQLVLREELMDDTEYEEIKEDIMAECQEYGQVVSIVIPRPSGDNEKVPGEGKVFVEFGTIEEATKAKEALLGRQFASRTVLADYFNPKKFHSHEYD